jgi:hypothetical protein
MKSCSALLNVSRRAFAAENKDLQEQSSELTQQVVAKEERTFYELQAYQHTALKQYFDQDALAIPLEDLERKVATKDFRFFLDYKNFYKMVDTLEKYQAGYVDIKSQDGREFIVFKRQLYQLYEISNRSAREHEAFSFDIERENLKWLQQANVAFQDELLFGNDLSDLNAHYHLKGKIFKRKTMDPSKLYGLTYFGVAGAAYSMFPQFALYLGNPLTTAGITASVLAGMVHLQEKDVVNSIEFVRDEASPHNGKLKFNVSTGPLGTSRDIFAEVNECMSVLSVGNDDLGEADIESNVVTIGKSWDSSNELNEKEEVLTLPADSWKDVNMLDWVLSIKHDESSLDSLFNDCMLESFDEKAASGGVSGLSIALMEQQGINASNSA